MSTRRTIALWPWPPPIVNEESKAAEAILPGHLVTYNAAGNLIKHNTAGTAAALTFALERDEMNKSIADAYAINDQVKVGGFTASQRVYAIIPSGQNVAQGDLVKSDGAGRLVAHGGTGSAIGRVLEDTDNSAGPGDGRCRVELI